MRTDLDIKRFCAFVILAALTGTFVTGEPQSSQSLSDEARAVAQQFWERTLKRCGDSYYYFLGRETNRFNRGKEAFEFHIEKDPLLRLFQMKGLIFYVAGNSLSQADQLNGVQWSGAIYWRANAVRERTFIGTGSGVVAKRWEAWSEWKSWSDDIGENNSGRVINSINLLKQNGKWSSAWRAGGWELVSNRIDDEWKLPSCENITADDPGVPAPYDKPIATSAASSKK